MRVTCMDLPDDLARVARGELGETPERRDTALAELRADLVASAAQPGMQLLQQAQLLHDAALLAYLRGRKFDVARAHAAILSRQVACLLAGRRLTPGVCAAMSGWPAGSHAAQPHPKQPNPTQPLLHCMLCNMALACMGMRTHIGEQGHSPTPPTNPHIH